VRYAIDREIAVGGMGSVHLGRDEAGRVVAIKRPHPALAAEPSFVKMFVHEAKVAARVRHPHVVTTLDVVVAEAGEPWIVMEYIAGGSLAKLLAKGALPVRVAAAIGVGIARGLHAAHEARDASGAPLELVHRDVTPHNVIVGVDGIARLLDFGIAKAAGASPTTREGQIKGKLAYVSPELLQGGKATRASDIWSAGVVLWESLAGRRLFDGEHEAQIVSRVLGGELPSPSDVRTTPADGDEDAALAALEGVVVKALSREPTRRFDSAEAFARAIESAVPPASPAEVARVLTERLADDLEAAAQAVEAVAGRSRRRSSRAVLVAALAVFGGVVLGLALARGPVPGVDANGTTSGSATPSSPAATADTSAPASARAPSSPPSLPSASTGPSLAPALASSPAGPAVPPHASVSDGGASPARAAPKGAPSAVAKPKAKPACDPPYRLGPAGEKIFKPECF
jgi:serine/threonine-protein kinase